MEKIKKELVDGLRLIVLSIIPVIITGINIETGKFDINWLVVIAVGCLTALKTVSAILNEIGKADDSQLKGGLTRF